MLDGLSWLLWCDAVYKIMPIRVLVGPWTISLLLDKLLSLLYGPSWLKILYHCNNVRFVRPSIVFPRQDHLTACLGINPTGNWRFCPSVSEDFFMPARTCWFGLSAGRRAGTQPKSGEQSRRIQLALPGSETDLRQDSRPAQTLSNSPEGLESALNQKQAELQALHRIKAVMETRLSLEIDFHDKAEARLNRAFTSVEQLGNAVHLMMLDQASLSADQKAELKTANYGEVVLQRNHLQVHCDELKLQCDQLQSISARRHPTRQSNYHGS